MKYGHIAAAACIGKTVARIDETRMNVVTVHFVDGSSLLVEAHGYPPVMEIAYAVKGERAEHEEALTKKKCDG